MGRISSPQGRGSQMHNRREYDSIGHDIPDNIDQEKTAQNITLVDRDIKEVYHELFDDAVKRYNENQKRAERKIDDYYNKVMHSKNNEKPFYEDVLQWGSKEDFEKDPQLREKARDALLQYAEGFQERNPNMIVIGAYIHMDEASPHLHLDYVPVAHGYKTGMDTRNGLDKAVKEMGFVPENDSRKNNATKLWKENERKVFKDICQELGLEVEQERKARGSLSVDEYKEAKQKMLGELEKEAAELTRSAEFHKSLVERSSNAISQLFEQATELKGQIQESTDELDKINTQVEKSNARLDKLNELKERLGKEKPEIYSTQVGGLLNRHDVTVVEGYSPQEVTRVFQRAYFRDDLEEGLKKTNTRSETMVENAKAIAQKELDNARDQIAWANQMLRDEAARKRKLDEYEKTVKEKNAALAAENQKLLSDNNRLLPLREELSRVEGELLLCRDKISEERDKIKNLTALTSELELNPEAAKKLLNDSIVETLTNKVSFLTCQELEKKGLLNKQAELAYMEINNKGICALVRDEFENFIERVKEHMIEIAERSNNFIHSLHRGR